MLHPLTDVDGSAIAEMPAGKTSTTTPVYAMQGPPTRTCPCWLTLDDGRVLGVTTMLEECPPFLFTEDERAEPSIFLATTVTDPNFAGRRLGCLIAWWALDQAHRTGFTWVRRGTGPHPRLVRYYTDAQGWEPLRTMERKGATVYAFQRRAEPQPKLAGLVAALD